MLSNTLLRWNHLYWYVNDMPVVGRPGFRHPENPCTSFKPEADDSIDDITCSGDGHYLCRECMNLSVEDNCFGLVPGSWECPRSPSGFCMYEFEDTAQDFCVHCGNPDERK